MEDLEAKLKTLILHQPDVHHKLAINLARHTNPAYSKELYTHIEAPDILFLVGSAALGKSLSAKLCASMSKRRYLEIELNMVPANCGQTVACQIYDFLREAEDDVVIFLDEIGSKTKSNTNTQFWRYLYEFFNTGKLSLNKTRAAPVGIPGKITILLAGNVGQQILDSAGMKKEYLKDSKKWHKAQLEIEKELKETLFGPQAEVHIVSRIMKPATIIYYFAYDQEAKLDLVQHLFVDWLQQICQGRGVMVKFPTDFVQQMVKIWNKDHHDLRSLTAVYRKLLIDLVAATTTDKKLLIELKERVGNLKN